MKDKGLNEVVPEQRDEQNKLLNGNDTVILNGGDSNMVNGDGEIPHNDKNIMAKKKETVDRSSTNELHNSVDNPREDSEENPEECRSEEHLYNGEYSHVAQNSTQNEPLTIYYEYYEPMKIKELYTSVDRFDVDSPIDKLPVHSIDFEKETEIPLLQKDTKNNTDILGNLQDKYPLKLDLSTKGDKWTYDIDSSTYTETTVSRTQSCLDDPPDGGWGWVVTFSAFMVGLILDGISFSFGIFFKELYVYFNESKSLTSWIISVMNGTYLAIGPVSSALVAAYGCRKVAIFGAILSSFAFFVCTWSPNVQVMILVYGLVGGTGLGQMYLPTIVTVGHYFKKKRALATGIAVCGSGIGGFVFAPLSQYLIDKYTWKGAMWVISAIALNGVVVASLLRPIEHRSNYKGKKFIEVKVVQTLQPVEVEKRKGCDPSAMFDFHLLKSPTFLLYGISCFLCMLGFFIPFTFIPDLVVDNGMTSKQGAILISIIGALNTVGRVLVGWVCDRSWSDAIIINSAAVVVGGATTMFVPYYGSFGLLATYSVIFGLAAAVFAALRPVILAELLGVAKLTSSFGLVTLCQGLASFIGAPIAGAVSDLTGNYKGAFFFAGATICLSGLICFPLRKISEWELRRMEKNRGK